MFLHLPQLTGNEEVVSPHLCGLAVIFNPICVPMCTLGVADCVSPRLDPTVVPMVAASVHLMVYT